MCSKIITYFKVVLEENAVKTKVLANQLKRVQNKDPQFTVYFQKDKLLLHNNSKSYLSKQLREIAAIQIQFCHIRHIV